MASPNISVTVDMASNGVSVTLPSDTVDSSPMLFFTCLKTSFFSSSIDYTVTRNTPSNVVTSFQAVQKSNISTSHVFSRASTQTSSWKNTVSGAIDVSFNFNNMGERRFRFDASNGMTLSSLVSGRLGCQVLSLVAHCYNIKRPVGINDVFSSSDLLPGASGVENAITNRLAATLALQTNQNIILQKLIDTHGPFIGDEASGSITYGSTFPGLNITFNLDNIKINISTPSVRTLLLRNIKVQIQLV